MIVSPLGRDQDLVAGHVVTDGTGLLIEEGAGVDTIRRVMQRVVQEPTFRQASGRAFEALRPLDDGRVAVEILERLAKEAGGRGGS